MALSSQRAMEVPLCSIEADAPLREVPACGEPLFSFAALPAGSASAGKVAAAQGVASCARALVWQLDGRAPAELLLAEVAVNEERRGAAVRLSFGCDLLPAVSCVEVPEGGTRVAVLTADGALHTVWYGGASAARAGAAALPPGTSGLARQLAAADAVVSVPLATHFQLAGAPTTLLEVGGWTCVGTSEGNVVCLPAGSSDPAAAVVLAPSSGLSKMFGGLFGRQGGQAVCQLAQLRHMDHHLLCAIHDSCTMRLWDLNTRRLVHSADLVTHEMQGRWAPTLARLTAEPLDAATSILLVYLEPADAAGDGGGDGGAAGGAGSARGMLATYEIFLEKRGAGEYKVLLELGPRLQGEVHRLHDLVLENVALHTIGAWMLYDDAAGRRRLNCVPVGFNDGPVQLEMEVLLTEDQLLEGCPSPADLPLAEEVLRAVEGQLGAAGAALPPGALGSALADAVLAPGRLSRAALAGALAALGSGVPREAVVGADLEELRRQLPRWVAAVPAAAAAGTGGGPTGALLARWGALLRAYARAWQDAHLPLALLALPPQGDAHSLMLLARRGGMVTALRPAATPETSLKDGLSADWHQAAPQDAAKASAVFVAAAAVFEAAGGSLAARLVWACLREGRDLRATVLPALVRSLAVGAPGPLAAGAPPGGGSRLGFPAAGGGGGSGGAGSAHAQQRTSCRKLPLRLSQLGNGGSFAEAVAAALRVLGAGYEDGSRMRTALTAASKPVRAATLATLAQVAWAQLQALLQVALLLQYTLQQQTLGSWSMPAEDAQELEADLLPHALGLLQAAAAAYWAAVTPTADGGAAEGGAGGPAVDPSQLVRALRIGDGAGAGTAAPKRARLSQAAQDSYVAGLLLAPAAAAKRIHVVRDLPDIQRVSLLFAQHLLCLTPSPLHAVPARRLRVADLPGQALPLGPADQAVEIAAALFRARQTAQLAALQRLLPADGQDMRLLFFKACGKARQIGLAGSTQERHRLEEDSLALFFRVATVFAAEGAFPGQAAAVDRCVAQMLADLSAGAVGGGGLGDGPEAAEVRYYQALLTLYERLGRYSAAARFALAAVRQVAAALPGPEQLAVRAAAQGRLWANVFNCMLEAGRYEEAYVALLSSEVAEVQLDCLHRLIGTLCAAPGGLELLCRLPFAHNMLLMRGGRQAWVPMLEEVAATLQRRAAQLDLTATPQPYKVLADFYLSRSNYQAAAGAMLAYARRLGGDCPDELAQLAEAERALATAVSCLSLVERQHAWVEDPAPPEAGGMPGGGGGGGGDDGELEEPPVLTLAALQREYAVVRGHAVLAAAMPGGERGHASLSARRGGGGEARGGDAEDVFSQLLALGLHDDAFQLAEAAFEGTQLTRALERAFASLAAACVAAQLARGGGSGGGSFVAAREAAGGGDDMQTEEGGAGGGAAGGGAAPAAAAAAASRGDGGAADDWGRLKAWLARHEGGAHRFRLRLVILEAVLHAAPAFMLPPWLMAPLWPSAPVGASGAAAAPAAPPSADLAGALRVLMRHARLADAAELAAAHLQAALRAVPSVGMARTSQVYFPQALLDELVSQLSGAAGLAAERAQLGELLGRVRDAAAQQTSVIQQLYGH